jgi:hypothetical protein
MRGHAEDFMAGRVKKLIDEFIELRTAGQQGLEHFVRAHLVLSGVNPNLHTASSPDDPALEKKLRKMIADFSAPKG